MDSLWLLVVGIPLFLLIGAVMGMRALAITRQLRVEVEQLQARVHRLESGKEGISAQSPSTASSTPEEQAPASSQPPQQPAQVWEPSQRTKRPLIPVQNSSPPQQPASTAPEPDTANKSPGLFDRLTTSFTRHWMTWLGGLCVGLAGVFMVRYSIEQGLLGPEARVILSLLAGVGLHAAAEWLRRRQGQNTVFASLAGGASIILYSALFAAFKLLPEMSPGLLFFAMALVSFATMVLALRHGPILAALGMLGGYLVPILVSTGSGKIELALIYIAILTLFSLWLLGYVQRRWLWLGVIAGSLLWWLLSLGTSPADGVRSLYLLALAYLFLAVPRHDWLLSRTEATQYSWLDRLKSVRDSSHWPVIPTLGLITLAQGFTLATEGVPQTGYPTFLLFPALLLLVASRRPLLNPLPALMLALTALAVVVPMLSYIGDQLIFTAPNPETQAALVSRFVMLTLLYTAASAWLLQRRIEHPGFWAALGCFTPLLMLALGYYLFTAFSADWAWGGAALILGMVYLALARLALERGSNDLIKTVLFSSAHLGLSLAAVTWFTNATLTLALALQLISLALLQQRFQLKLLPWVMRLLLAVVVCRLTFNPWLLSYDMGSHWSLWTYGGATACAFTAAWILRQDARMTAWLQGAGAHLLVLTLAAEVRYWLYDGDIFQHQYSFIEASLNTLIWGTAGCVYLWRAQLSQYLKRFYQVVASLHLVAAGANYALIVLLRDNPLWSSTGLSDTPIWNQLLLSYGLPCVLLLVLWRQLPEKLGRWMAIAAGLNLLLFVSLEIRHLWQGGTIHLSHSTPDGELYTYSVVWLLMASVAMVAGSWLQHRTLYRGGMGLLLVVVAKLFLVDMSDLTGLWRVASFMGLGLALLGLAWLHQRFTPTGTHDTRESATQ